MLNFSNFKLEKKNTQMSSLMQMQIPKKINPNTYVKKPYVNQAHINQALVNQAHVNRAHVNRSHVDQAHVNRSHVDQAHVNPIKNNSNTSQIPAVNSTPAIVNNNEQSIIIKNTLPFKENVYSLIPLNIFQTWKTLSLPRGMRNTVNTLKRQNPEFKYHLYDDEMCREFIKSHFSTDILYAFDKLIPGAYKADLWRYCVLYIHGGIYLDIKYSCVNNFKLISLTDKEYYVIDRIVYGINTGIYQAFLVSLPGNEILLKCINQIFENVKANTYMYNELYVTGPHLMAKYFNSIEIGKLELTFTGNSIIHVQTKLEILKEYETYREEQRQLPEKYYRDLWNTKDVYNYPTLMTTKKLIISRQINRNVYGRQIVFYSSTPTIIEKNNDPEKFEVVLGWINTVYDNYGCKVVPFKYMYLNSRFTVNKQFQQLDDEVFLEEDFLEQEHYPGTGIENIKIIKYDNNHYYLGTYYDKVRNATSISAGKCDLENKNEFTLPRNIILPSMYDTNSIKITEKNWAFVNYRSEHCLVYNWYPLQICKIDYTQNKLVLTEIKYNIPKYFQDARGSTIGVISQNEIWFVLHKAQSFVKNEKHHVNYQDFFAVFDLDMHLLKYSELFKYGNTKVQFCTGLVMTSTEIILSYSLNDTQSILASYDRKYIDTGIKWYTN
jgi:mannosyltransferase OCH1-like enzyme